ncbi:hypothetical protein [Nocardia sp. NPDC056100]|uniref:DUF7257 domain-containing protein n=1 Tax=Nocardia sp. NPDC056100 TaxID=3345712 RepID=UPI0035DD9738
MTSPDRSVPPGAYVGGAGAGNGVSNLQKVTWEGARDSIVRSITGSFGGVANASTNWQDTTDKAQSAAVAAKSQSSDASSTVRNAQVASTANAALIASLANRQTGQQTGGTTLSDDFERTALGTGYSTFKTGPIADLTIVSGQVQLNQQGDQNTGDVVALSKTMLLTDDQSMSAVMGRANQASNVALGLYVRAAADLSTFVFAGVKSNSVSIGYGTRTGATTKYTQWVAVATTVNTGDTVILQAVGAGYQVLVNGVPVLGYTDSAKVSPVGAANRSVGFSSGYYWSGLFGYFTFAIAGIAAADLTKVPVTGYGWALVRLSTTGATQSSGSRAVAAGTFDTVRQLSGVSVYGQGPGQIQVPVAGWYRINVGLYYSGRDSELRADLWWTPSAGGSWAQLRTGPKTNQIRSETTQNGTDGDGNPVYVTNDYGYAQSTAASFVVFLPAGAIVAPGYAINANNGLVGPYTYFDGALINRA